jgi:hypothetical protein
VENSPTAFVLLGEQSCAKTCASLVLECRRSEESWQRAADEAASARATLQGFSVRVELLRARRMQEIRAGERLPPGRALQWRTQMQWSG